MPQTASGAELYTKVKNTSGVSKHFGFLGAHGRTLAANATFEHPGDLVADMALANKRKFDGLIRSLKAGNLSIVSSPAHYLLDRLTGETQTLALRNEHLGTVDPLWNSDGSADFDDDE